jgi:hypothetical protein
MAAYKYPITTLMDAVVTSLTADAGLTVNPPHYFGRKFLEQLDAPPRYVWVPSRSKQVLTTSTRAVNQPRMLAADAEQVEIWCWGKTFTQAWAMRHNVRRACFHVAGAANIRSEGGDWRRPAESWTQLGELYVIELSVNVPIFDAYVDVEALTYPEVDTATIGEVQGDIEATESLGVPGESYVTTTTEDL